MNKERETCVSLSIVGMFEVLLASTRAFLKRSVREELGSMIKSSIGHVIGVALLSLPPLSIDALAVVIAAFATACAFPSSRVS